MTARRAARPEQSAYEWSYVVQVTPELDLQVSASFQEPFVEYATLDERLVPFVHDVSVRADHGVTPVVAKDDKWKIACSECSLRYSVSLRKAAATLSIADTALLTSGVVVAPPSSFLIHPDESAPHGRYRFQVIAPKGVRFETGVRKTSAGTSAGSSTDFAAAASTLEQATFAAFGPLRTYRERGSNLRIAIAPGLAMDDRHAVEWVGSEIGAITDYFGRPPSDQGLLLLVPGTSEVNRGVTLSGGGASVLIRVGTRESEATLRDDWVVAHELVHVAFPSLDYDDTWFSEGLASYVEPVARLRAGLTTKERVWADFVAGLPQGLPLAGDAGLAGTHEWGRVYWGGTLYFLLADLEIRERSAGKYSLMDAVRAASAGAGTEVHRSLTRVIELGDRATGTSVLAELYDRLARRPGTVDLDALWAKLGVSVVGGRASFTNQAPLAAIRMAISAPAPPRAH